MAESWLIGSAADCDLVVRHPNVSSHHCRLTRTAIGWSLEDLQSSNGTFVNRVRIVESFAVSQRDSISLGSSVEMPWPDSLAAGLPRGKKLSDAARPCQNPPLPNASFDSTTSPAIRRATIVLGRDPDCDQVFDNPEVSWRHAKIEQVGTRLFVEDLKSSNGTFVNDELICKRTEVTATDVIGLGSCRFILAVNANTPTLVSVTFVKQTLTIPEPVATTVTSASPLPSVKAGLGTVRMNVFASPSILGVTLIPLVLIVAAWGLWPREHKIETLAPQATHESSADAGSSGETERGGAHHAKVEIPDPQEYLVLIGVGDLATDNRPLLLGIGWLWDERTAVISRTLGDALSELVAATRLEGAPRQVCVIQGVPLEVTEIASPADCPEISVLRLKESAELLVPARKRWLTVNATDIERRRVRKRPLTHVSYEMLPRSPGSLGKHGLSLHAYDPDVVKTTSEDARFLYEQHRHILRPLGTTARLERGGLVVDEEGRIVGMILLDASAVWTETLQRALASASFP